MVSRQLMDLMLHVNKKEAASTTHAKTALFYAKINFRRYYE